MLGPIARTVRDTALLLQAIAPDGASDYTEGAEISSLRVGVPRAHFYEALHPEVDAAVETALAVLKNICKTQQTADLEKWP